VVVEAPMFLETGRFVVVAVEDVDVLPSPMSPSTALGCRSRCPCVGLGSFDVEATG
jgi:hypothetical protein